jgi:hypothetical protein
MLDADKDGRLTLAELPAIHRGRSGGRGRPDSSQPKGE